MSCYVVVSGLPAAGKSTVGAGLAAASSLPLFDKDQMLEQLFDKRCPSIAAERRSLSQRADRQLESAVRESKGAIVVSWWRHPASPADSGTPTSWLEGLAGVVEVYCESTPEAAARRFLGRIRHPGHMDDRWSYEDLLTQFSEAAQRGPLTIGPVVAVDAFAAVDFKSLWKQVQNASRTDRGAR
jgi:hypothetical protein